MLTVKFLFSKYNYDIFSLFQKQNSRLIPKEKNIWVIKVPENTKKRVWHQKINLFLITTIIYTYTYLHIPHTYIYTNLRSSLKFKQNKSPQN